MTDLEGALRLPDDARIAIIASRWNPGVVEALAAGARRALLAHGVPEAAIDMVRVPGAWEIPLACEWLARAGAHAALVAVGCVVRGDTRHYEQVADGCSAGLAQVALEYALPVANGVLAVERHEDAKARADGALGNKGEEAALAALEMIDLGRQLR